VTADSALDLARALGTSPEVWLSLQMYFDLKRAGGQTQTSIPGGDDAAVTLSIGNPNKHRSLASPSTAGRFAGMHIQAEVRESTIFGKGLFPLEPVAKGKIVCFFAIGAQVITEERFLAAVAKGEHRIVRTGTRYAGKYFTIGNEHEPYTFLNHSFEPNLLCHCGIVIARRSIPTGEELTLDYRTLIDDTDVGTYADAATGQTIRGFSAAETFARTAREFAAIIEQCPGWTG
jgi:hypothetical protein